MILVQKAVRQRQIVADKQGYVHDVMDNSRKHLTNLMVDLDAKPGLDDTVYQDIMERYGFQKINENGEKFANLYVFNKMVIGGTI